MRYIIEGSMREKGALGISSHNVMRVEADSPRAALLKAYDTHEHLQGCTITHEGGEPLTQAQASDWK